MRTLPHVRFVWMMLLVLSVVSGNAPVSGAPDPGGAPEAETIVPRAGLLIGQAETGAARDSSLSDAIEAMLTRGTLASFRPGPGQTLGGKDGPRWAPVDLNETGGVERRGEYLYIPIESDEPRVMILGAAGHAVAYFNGEPRAGDPYSHGYVHLPVLLNKGVNPLLLRTARGPVQAKLYAPPDPVFLLNRDIMAPDLIVGEPTDAWGAAVVINATRGPVSGFSIAAGGPSLTTQTVSLPAIPPLSVRKAGFRLQGPAPAEEKKIEGTLELRGPGGSAPHRIALNLRAVDARKPHKRTFISEIDGSVQYYSLRRAGPLSSNDPPPAIVLSCHGAGVEAQGQCAAYSAKTWLHLVAPTNRRPYGFDWEGFGRADAMEVLEIAKKTLPHDPSRIYLTGHSMGGHGAWHLGVTYPDAFAAIGPSAGWISRESYGRSRRDSESDSPVETIARRGEKAGDTIALANNLKSLGVYILHGAEDDNVPVAQARRMADVLGAFHRDWVFHEEPGKGHWWSNEYGDNGNASVDWPFMFDWFARHALPPVGAVRHVEFATVNPGVSNHCFWVSIEGQTRQHDLSKVVMDSWPNKRVFKGTTENVSVLRFDAGRLFSPGSITVELDGQTIKDIAWAEETGAAWLQRDNGQWRPAEKPPLTHKGPHRYGSVRDELKHRFFFVYGSRGSDEENAWAFAKARFDAETFWYRGNASVEVIQDTEFDPRQFADRSVVLYGNADTNAAWPALLGDSPVQARRGQVAVGQRVFNGDDLAAVFLRPRQDSGVASVIAVSGSGPIGLRSNYLQSFFLPFANYPDCVVTRAAGAGTGRAKTLAAGYFGLDWYIENGEFEFAR